MALSPISRTCQLTIDRWLKECESKYHSQRLKARQMADEFPGLGYERQAEWCKAAEAVCRDLALQNSRRRIKGGRRSWHDGG